MAFKSFASGSAERDRAPTLRRFRLREIIPATFSIWTNDALYLCNAVYYVRPLEREIFFRSHPGIEGEIPQSFKVSILHSVQERFCFFYGHGVHLFTLSLRKLRTRRRVARNVTPDHGFVESLL